VDFYLAPIYRSIGIPTDLFTAVFAVSRMSGWVAHILEQYGDDRLLRPRAEYIGPVGLEYRPIRRRR
jgi:citrate synthase